MTTRLEFICTFVAFKICSRHQNALRATIEGHCGGDVVASGHDAYENAVYETGLSSSSTPAHIPNMGGSFLLVICGTLRLTSAPPELPCRTACQVHMTKRKSQNAAPFYDASMRTYEDAYRESIESPDTFWRPIADRLVWHKQYTQVVDATRQPFNKWCAHTCAPVRTWHRFVGGQLNACYNALDRHVAAGFGMTAALLYDSPVTNVQQHFSYSDLLSQVRHWLHTPPVGTHL